MNLKIFSASLCLLFLILSGCGKENIRSVQNTMEEGPGDYIPDPKPEQKPKSSVNTSPSSGDETYLVNYGSYCVTYKIGDEANEDWF